MAQQSPASGDERVARLIQAARELIDAYERKATANEHFLELEAAVDALVVVAREVVDAADGWAAAEGGVGAVHVVPVDPGWQGTVAGGVGAVQPPIGPLLEQGPVEPLHLPIGLWPIWSGALMTHAGVGQRRPE